MAGDRRRLTLEGLHSGVITHTVSSADPDYNGMLTRDVTVNIRDFREVVTITSDAGGENVIDSIDVAEGGGDVSYWVRLKRADHE